MHRHFSFLTSGMIFLLCALPVVAVLSPRAMAFAPAVVGLIGFIGYRLEDGVWPALPRTIALGFAAVAALMCLSVLWGYDSAAITLKYPLKTLPVFLGSALLSAVFATKRAVLFPLLQRFFPLACFVAGDLLMIDFYGDSFLYRLVRGGDVALEPLNLSHLNRSVVAFSLCGFLALGMLFYRAKSVPRRSVLAAVLVALLLMIMLHTHSQSMQLAVCVGFITLFLAPYGWRYGWMVVALIISVCLVATPFLTQALFEYFAPNATHMTWLQQAYAAPRMEIWDFVSRRALERPWLGHGIEATRSITDFDIAHLYNKRHSVLHPHSFAVQVWIEFGLLGALLFATLKSLCLRSIWHNPSSTGQRFQFCLFVMVLVMAAISYGMWQGWWVGLIGFTLAGAQLFYPADEALRSAETSADKSSGNAAS